MIFVAVEASPVGSKPPAADGQRISKIGKHGLGDTSPFSTRMSSLQGRAGGSVIMPTLIELVFGSGATRRAEKLSPDIACTAVAAPSVRSRVFVFAGPSTSMARRDCRASCSRLDDFIHDDFIQHFLLSIETAVHYFVLSIESFFKKSVYILQRGFTKPEVFLLGEGPLPSGTASLSFSDTLGKPRARGR